jgi:cytochrome P450
MRKVLPPELDRLRDPAVMQSPFALLARLRTHAPVAFSPSLGAWVVTRYEHACELLQSPRRFSSYPSGRAVPSARWTAALDDLHRAVSAPHQRLRRQAGRAFAPALVATFAPAVEAAVGDLLDARVGDGRIEFMADVARPLPLLVLAEVMAVPHADRGSFIRWCRGVADRLDPAVVEASGAAAGDRVFGELRRYLATLIAERAARPGTDMLSRLAAAGTELDDAEVLDLALVFAAAGHDTSGALLGNLVHALLVHPDQLTLLHRDRGLIDGAIEETLRWNPPVQYAERVAIAETQLGGVRIPAGDLLLAMISAANRDAALVDDPERFDIGRPPVRHTGFGAGAHFCTGAGLARLEAGVMLATLLDRLPGLRLAPDPQLSWAPSRLLRRLERLPLRFDVPRAR